MFPINYAALIVQILVLIIEISIIGYYGKLTYNCLIVLLYQRYMNEMNSSIERYFWISNICILTEKKNLHSSRWCKRNSRYVLVKLV